MIEAGIIEQAQQHPTIEIESVDDKFRVTSSQDLGEFSSFQAIADHIDIEVEENAVEVAKLNTIIAIVGLIQFGLIMSAFKDGDYRAAVPIAAIALLLTYIRSSSLKPNKQKREASWQRAQNFENYVTTLQEPYQIYPDL